MRTKKKRPFAATGVADGLLALEGGQPGAVGDQARQRFALALLVRSTSLLQ